MKINVEVTKNGFLTIEDIEEIKETMEIVLESCKERIEDGWTASNGFIVVADVGEEKVSVTVDWS